MEERIISLLAGEWRQAGVEQGDVILIHSSLGRTLRRIRSEGVDPSPDLVIRSFLAALGEEGTLILPLFNFDFPNGVKFDIRSTPSQMGAFTEAARKWPGAVRTGHPVYSFAVIGKQAHRFDGVCNASGYGADSPFGILHGLNGKIGVIDLPDQNSMTFYHYVEESLGVPYRFQKTFTGPYVDQAGGESVRSFSIFVRDIDKGVLTHVDPMGEILWSEGCYKGCRPNEGCGLRTISAAVMFERVAQVIKSGKAEGLLYAIEH